MNDKTVSVGHVINHRQINATIKLTADTQAIVLIVFCLVSSFSVRASSITIAINWEKNANAIRIAPIIESSFCEVRLSKK